MGKRDDQVQINDVSRIAYGTEVTGSLVSPSDLRIDGKFTGNIKISAKLVVGENAVINGNIVCDSADVYGEINGALACKECVTFRGSAKYTGDLSTLKITIEINTVFNGSCKMIQGEEFAKISEEFKL